jgi:hypothetical protein
MILSTSYLPPVWYIEKCFMNNGATIDYYEHFVKQTIRNRAHILSPNGVQSLIIPIVHNNRTNSPVKDIRISYDQPWQRQHWRSLNAAYRRSAFFEFYMDDFAPFYHQEFEFLIDFNIGLLELILDTMKLKPEINFTEKYLPSSSETPNDFRSLCDVGVANEKIACKSYPQVFGYKNGFVPGLSFVDLLFNMGPQAATYFTSSMQQPLP